MADPVARVLSALTLVGVLLLTWSSWGVSGQLDGLQADVAELAERDDGPRLVLPAPQPTRTAPVQRPRGKARKSKAKWAAPDPEASDRKQRRRERLKARANLMREEFQVFSQEHGIDDETGRLVLEELQLAKESTALVRSDVHDGKISAKDGRAEIQAVRADTDAALVDLLGEDTTAALKDRLADWFDKDED